MNYFAGGIVSNAKLKRARSTGTKNKSALLLYNKLSELISCLAELVEVQELTDTLILQVIMHFEKQIVANSHMPLECVIVTLMSSCLNVATVCN